jgi:ribonuclease Y
LPGDSPLFIGVIVGGYLLYKRKIKSQPAEVAEEKAKLIILKKLNYRPRTSRKIKIIDAKDKLFKMKQEFEEEANRKKNQIISQRTEDQTTRIANFQQRIRNL